MSALAYRVWLQREGDRLWCIYPESVRDSWDHRPVFIYDFRDEYDISPAIFA